jgi:hypothetical protein
MAGKTCIFFVLPRAERIYQTSTACSQEGEKKSPTTLGRAPEFAVRTIQSINSFGVAPDNQLGNIRVNFPPLHSLGLLPPLLCTADYLTLSLLGRDQHTPPPLWCTVASGAASGLGVDIWRQSRRSD